MKLTRNFSLAELCKSETASRKGIDNTPTEDVINNLSTLTNMVLQKTRNKLGMVIVTSGYRSPELNRAIGGSTTSDHCLGFAADFEVVDYDNRQLALWIKDNLEYNQLILEYYKDGDPNSGWVHCSYSSDHNKNQFMKAYRDEEGKTRYEFLEK